MENFLLVGNVLFIKCELLGDSPNIVGRLYELSASCGFQATCCAIYTDRPDCNSFIIMYLDTIDLQEYQPPTMEDLLAWLEENSGIIMSMLLAVIADNVIELWDVCTDPAARRRGMMRIIFDTILAKTLADRVWLGIALDNPMWAQVLRFYAQAGFGKPTLTRNSGGVLRALSVTLLGLSWTRGKAVDADAVIRMAEYLRDQYLQAGNACSARLYGGKELCDYLKQYLDLDVEYAGTLVNGGYIQRPDGFVYANLVYPVQTMVKGEGRPNYMVYTPVTPVAFHTHPNICYRDLGCYVAWPSDADLSRIVYHYIDGVVKEYVITREGIYSMQLTLDTQLLLVANPGSREALATAVKKRYYNVLKFRSELIPPSQRQLQVGNFISFVNSYTMRELLSEAGIPPPPAMPDLDFSIFNVTFYHWMDIERNQGFMDCLVGVKCHLPVSRPGDISELGIGDNVDYVPLETQDPLTGDPEITC